MTDPTRNLPPSPGRQLDPVRAAALTQAIDLYRAGGGTATAHEVVTTAELFEAYLAGRGKSDTHDG